MTDNAIKNRIAIEKKIARKVVSLAIKAGLSVSVYNGEEFVLTQSVKVNTILKEMFSVDEEKLCFYNIAGKCVGMVFFVYGNSGFDVINDYSTQLDDLLFMEEVNKYADTFEN